MVQVSEKPNRFEIAQTDVVPVATAANLPALRPTTSIVPATSILKRYAELTVGFDKASADVGAKYGAPVPRRSGWTYFAGIFSGLVTSTAVVSTGIAALFTGSMAAATVPACIATGVAAVVGVVASGIMSDEGHFTKWADVRVARALAARAVRPLEPARIAFLKTQLAQATPCERAMIAELAKQWLAELDRREVIGKGSRDLLRDIVAQEESLPPEVKSASGRFLVLAQTLFVKGAVVSPVNGHVATRIIDACRALSDDEYHAVLPSLRAMLFDGEKPRVEMSFDACQTLLEALEPRPPASAPAVALLA